MRHEVTRIRENGDVSPIAPIAAVRVAGIRPVMPAPAADPFEDGLEVEAVTEMTFTPATDSVSETQSSTMDASADPGQNAFMRAAKVAPTAILGTIGDSRQVGQPRGNAQVSTGFDRTPAGDHGPAPRQSFASPFARAMATYGG